MNEVILPRRNTKIFSRETFSKQTNKIITTLVLLLGGMIIVLSAVFISMTSVTAQKGYELKGLQDQNEILRVEKEKLKTKLNESQSFIGIEETPKLKEMTAPEAKQFVTSKKEKLK